MLELLKQRYGGSSEYLSHLTRTTNALLLLMPVARWGEPTTVETLELPFLGAVIGGLDVAISSC